MPHTKMLIPLLLISLVLTTGCAVTLTMTGPNVEEIKAGDKSKSDAVSYNYVMREQGTSFELKKQPMCKELQQQIILKRKPMRGVIPAIIEIPLYGLGLVDLVAAGVYSKATEEERDGDIVKTGRVLTCGDFEPAPDEEIILQFPDSEVVKYVKTDSNGRVNLSEILPKTKRDLQINVFVKEHGGVAYIRTLDESRWY